jgi:hypothetical protein
VRFVYVIRVPVCASASRVCPVCVPAPPVSFYRYPPLCFRVSRVSRVCPGSPRCLFTGIPRCLFTGILPVCTGMYRIL